MRAWAAARGAARRGTVAGALVALALTLGACGGEAEGPGSKGPPVDPLGIGLMTGPVVVLGDSFASGEGAGGYVVGQPGALDGCRRSDATTGVAAAALVAERTGDGPAGAAALNVACSGALTEHITTEARPGVPAQLEQIGDVVPGAAIVTTGGNDIGFVDLVGECALGDASCAAGPALREATFAAIDSLEAELVAAYQAVAAELNTDAMVEARGGDVAPVVVVSYPQLLPVTAEVLCLGFDDDELALATEIVAGLNDAVEAAALAASQQGRPVYYAQGVEGAFDGQTACTSAPLVHWPATPSDVLELLQDPDSLGRELLHPTAEGYGVLAQAVAEWSRDEPLVYAHVDNGVGSPALEGDDDDSGEAAWTATAGGWLRVAGVVLALGALAWVLVARARLGRRDGRGSGPGAGGAQSRG